MRVVSVLQNTMICTLIYALCASGPLRSLVATEPSVIPEQPLAEFLGKQGYTAIPLIQSKDQHGFLVGMVLDGKPLLLLLDTGASAIFLSKAAGKKFGIDSYPIIPNAPDEDHKLYLNTKMGVGSVDRISIPTGKSQYLITRKQTIYAMEGLSSQVTLYNSEKLKNEKVDLDGLLGQDFLQAHCAIIDSETSTLFLIPIAVRDMPKLSGEWICTKGEKDGKPLENVSQNRLAIRSDGEAELVQAGQVLKGYLGLQGTSSRRIFLLGVEELKGKSKTLSRGIYSIRGDSLKLVLVDESSKRALDPKVSGAEICPTAFESKVDSGHIYYEFARKPPAKPKK